MFYHAIHYFWLELAFLDEKNSRMLINVALKSSKVYQAFIKRVSVQMNLTFLTLIVNKPNP